MITQPYNDLKLEIEMIEKRIEDKQYEIENELKAMHTPPKKLSGMCIDGQPKGSRDDTPLNVRLDRIRICEHLIEIDTNILNHKKNTMNEIVERLKKMEGLDNKVCYMRDVENMPLQAIADKLKYSLDYISKISSRNPRVF